jgi:hypothetical protein
MTRSAAKSYLVLGLIVALVVAAALPAQAQWTKLYKFANTTGADMYHVRAVTNGLEVITGYYSDRTYWVSGSPPSDSPKIYPVTYSGVYCTTVNYINYPNFVNGTAIWNPVPPGAYSTVGFRTADSTCRMRDLYWRWWSGAWAGAIMPESLGLNGGGELYQAPDGSWWMIITNDTAAPIQLTNLDFGTFNSELSLLELEQVLDVGMVEMRVEAIREDIAVLRAEVLAAGQAEDPELRIPSPSVNSLIRKSDKAEQLMDEGLQKYLAGDEARALFLWAKAAQQMENFISEVTNMSDKGNLPEYWYDRWMGVDGGSPITTVPEIRDALAALPGAPLQSLPPPQTPPPPPAGLDPSGYVEWPVSELLPGQYTALALMGVSLGDGVVLQGSVTDPVTGATLVEWIEGAVVAPPLPHEGNPPALEVSVSPPNLWPPNHEMIPMELDVTLQDDTQVEVVNEHGEVVGTRPAAVWYIESVSSNQDDWGTGEGDSTPDWWSEWSEGEAWPGQTEEQEWAPLWLRAERAGNHPDEVRIYSVTIVATDIFGNSTSVEVQIPVDHDQGSTTEGMFITSLAAAPTKGQGVQVTFTLAAAGQVEAEVLNIAGRRIKTIVADREYEKGTSSLVWNCHSDRGAAVPAGTYLIRVTARSADGQQAARLCAVTLGQ